MAAARQNRRSSTDGTISRKGTSPGPRAAKAPARSVKASAKAVKASAKAVKASAKAVKPSTRAVKPPPTTVKPPAKAVQPSAKAAKAPLSRDSSAADGVRAGGNPGGVRASGDPARAAKAATRPVPPSTRPRSRRGAPLSDASRDVVASQGVPLPPQRPAAPEGAARKVAGTFTTNPSAALAAGEAAASAVEGMAATAAAAGGLFPGSLPLWSIEPARMLALQNDYTARLQQLWSEFSAPEVPGPRLADKRFAADAWASNKPLAWNAALYLLNADFLQRMAESVESDAKTRERIRFVTQQWVDALAPSNFLATNPEVQQRLLETRGESLVHGIENLLADLGKGHISQTDEQAFEVGRNVGTSEGGVVFRNEVFELIQYRPTTAEVGETPLLLVPPFINKFYILDLQPENSFVAHAVARGHTVFLMSWCNPGPERGHLGWDDYVRDGVVKAIETVRDIAHQPRINALGFCVGGTILATALAALADRGEHPVESLTLMTSLLDFEEPGVLGVFIDPAHIAYRDQALGAGGVMTGRELASTFSFLRPNDLVWNYVVNNYLKGDSPPAFDLLYWNSDGTNLPGPLYCWYLRHMYLQNELRIPNRLEVIGQRIDVGAIDVPTYLFAAREDHIVPWRAAYASTQLLSNDLRFVLGASGHIAGAINPASKNRRSYWVGSELPPDPEDWLAGAAEKPGSWWTDWAAWLEPRKGRTLAAPARLGNARHPVIEPAPGSYVKIKAP
jgi:polyhydroxyalkanoate synthase subunit PhaC